MKLELFLSIDPFQIEFMQHTCMDGARVAYSFTKRTAPLAGPIYERSVDALHINAAFFSVF
jgi:hypothetical protein